MTEFTQSDYQKAFDCFIVTGDDDELYLGQWCERFQSEVRAALTRCANEAPNAVPEGYALVPIEPTEAMLIDVAASCRNFYQEKGFYPRSKAVWKTIISFGAAPTDTATREG